MTKRQKKTGGRARSGSAAAKYARGGGYASEGVTALEPIGDDAGAEGSAPVVDDVGVQKA